MGVLPVGQIDSVLLDGAGADPSQQVQGRASLVVGSGGAGAAEGLLSDHGAGALVVEVDVAASVLQATDRERKKKRKRKTRGNRNNVNMIIIRKAVKFGNRKKERK